MIKERKRIYPKIPRQDNDLDFFKNWINKKNEGKNVLIQEKIDGSNITFGIYNGEFKIYSRNQAITSNESFGKTNLQEFRDLEREIRKISNGYSTFLISGELLGQAKIEYNSKCDGTLNTSFYVFDIIKSKKEADIPEKIEQTDSSTWEELEKICLSLKLNTIPLISTISYSQWKKHSPVDFQKEFVESKPSLIYNTTEREGVVVKLEGTHLKYKIVSEKFKEENYSKTKERNTQLPFEISILERFATPARIEKIIQKLIESNEISNNLKDKKNFKKIFGKGTTTLTEDIIEEEIKIIKGMLAKKMRRISSTYIKDYLEKGEKHER